MRVALQQIRLFPSILIDSCVDFYKDLKHQKEYILGSQFLRSGTSVGANIHESQGAQSKKDFIHKLYIAFKEIKESIYWINLLLATNTGEPEKLNKLRELSIEISRLLSSIILSAKKTKILNS